MVKQVRESNRQKAETPEADKVSVSENLGERAFRGKHHVVYCSRVYRKHTRDVGHIGSTSFCRVLANVTFI